MHHSFITPCNIEMRMNQYLALEQSDQCQTWETAELVEFLPLKTKYTHVLYI